MAKRKAPKNVGTMTHIVATGVNLTQWGLRRAERRRK